MIRRLVGATLLAAVGCPVQGGEAGAVMNFEFRFGGSAANHGSVGLALSMPEVTDGRPLPVYGVAYTSTQGLVPALLGAPLIAGGRHAAYDDGDADASGMNWLLIVGGVAAATAVAMAVDERDGRENDDGPDGEGRTCVGGTNAVPPSEDFGVHPENCGPTGP